MRAATPPRRPPLAPLSGRRPWLAPAGGVRRGATVERHPRADVAIAESKMALGTGEADEAILDGYRAALEHGGRPFVLAEHASALRNMAGARLRGPGGFLRQLGGPPDLTPQGF